MYHIILAKTVCKCYTFSYDTIYQESFTLTFSFLHAGRA